MVANDRENSDRLIGNLISEAYFKDSGVRKRLQPIIDKLHSLLPMERWFAVAAFNHYLVSSYHSARAIDLLSAEAKKKYQNKEWDEFRLLVILEHAFKLEAIVHLNCARSFVTQKPIQETLGDPIAEEVLAAFDGHFPRLVDARHSLVHDDERVLGFYDKKERGKEIEDIQVTELNGTKLKTRDRDGKDFTFDFHPRTFIDLLDSFQKAIDKIKNKMGDALKGEQ